VLFGAVSGWLGGTSERGVSAHTAGQGPVSAQAAAGLADAFSIMLLPLLAAGLLIVFWARRTYPRDVATAVASDEAVREPEEART